MLTLRISKWALVKRDPRVPIRAYGDGDRRNYSRVLKALWGLPEISQTLMTKSSTALGTPERIPCCSAKGLVPLLSPFSSAFHSSQMLQPVFSPLLSICSAFSTSCAFCALALFYTLCTFAVLPEKRNAGSHAAPTSGEVVLTCARPLVRAMMGGGADAWNRADGWVCMPMTG